MEGKGRKEWKIGGICSIFSGIDAFGCFKSSVVLVLPSVADLEANPGVFKDFKHSEKVIFTYVHALACS